MKKRLIALFAATAVAAGTLFVTGCGSKDSEPSPSETFSGSVSAGVYTSQNEAVAACVATELSGDGSVVEMTKYEKDTDLSPKEIEKLAIASEVNGTIESVEKGKAYFTELSSASAYAAAASESGVYITVYVIKFTPAGSTTYQYKYLIPLPENGEALSMSYLESVMDADKYKNCTVDCTIDSTSKVMGMSVTMTLGFNMAITETQAKINYTVSMLGQSETFAIYLAESQGSVNCVAESRGEFYDFDLSDIDLEINSISDLYTSQITEVECLTHVKTNYGFKMQEEFLAAVNHAAVDSGLGNAGVIPGTTVYDTPSCEYRVVDGKLYKMTNHLGGKGQINNGSSTTTMTISVNTVVKYTNFGTTTVTIPDGAKTLLGLNN